eukprot:TRINITY_DN19415_c0_g2_i1.p1 TRINITY_DN19415_c0_g2~~TRINITY_DN19415_c0_g2_i1.p1  ORF type:complete len:1480 (+),score=426.97 TRINITY_DN19415_c0_g2_i1:61-4440(+)
MEKELSDDFMACVNSPRGDEQTGNACSNSIVAVEPVSGSTTAWIDKQICSIEHRREACELRQAHLAGLRRLVSEIEQGKPTQSKDAGLAEEPAPGSGLADKLAQLVAEHAQLKQRAESEREEFLRIRNSLEEECERRLHEVRSIAKTIEEGKKLTSAAEDAAKQKLREARMEINALQERLEEAETTVEQERGRLKTLKHAHAATDADLKQLEDHSQIVVEECRSLQQQVREFELERAAFREVQASSEEERLRLQTKIRELEQLHADTKSDYLGQLDEIKLKHKRLWDAEHAERLDRHKDEADARHAAVLADLEAVQREKESLEAHRAADIEARCKMEQQHQEVLYDLEKFHSSQARLRSDLKAEKEAKEEMLRHHEEAMQDAERLHTSKQKLQEAHAQVMEDMAKVKEDRARLEEDLQREINAREKAEEAYAAIARSLEQVCCDKERVEQEKQQEMRLRQGLEQMHADALREKEELPAASTRLQEDVDAEQCAKDKLACLHQAVLEEKNTLSNNCATLQKILVAEQRAKEEFQRKHQAVEQDKDRVEQELRDAKEAEELMRKQVETKHGELVQDIAKLRIDQAKLEEDCRQERQALAEAKILNEKMRKDKECLEADYKKLEEDKAREVQAKLDFAVQRDAVTQELAEVKSDQRKLQLDNEFETRAKEELDRRHRAVIKDLEQVQADLQKLKLDRDLEVQVRADLEHKHEAALQEMQQLKSARDMENHLKDAALSRHEASQKDVARFEAECQKLREELRQVATDRDRHMSEHENTKNTHEQVLSQINNTHEEARVLKQTAHTEEISRLNKRHEEEHERLENQYNVLRAADQKLLEEMQGKLVKLQKEKSEIIASLRLEAVQQDEQHRETHKSELGKIQSLQSELVIARQKCQILEQNITEIKEAGKQTVDRLQREKTQIASDFDRLTKQKEEMHLAENALKSAVSRETEQCDSLKSQILQLKAQLTNETRQCDNLKSQVQQLKVNAEEQQAAREQKKQADMEVLQEKLKQEQQQSEALRFVVDEMRRVGEELQRDAKDAMDQSDQVKRQLEATWRHRLEEKELELKALRDAQAAVRRASQTAESVRTPSTPPSGQSLRLPTQVFTQPLGTMASLRGESILPEPQDHDMLLEGSGADHDYVAQVREAQTGLAVAMENANRVHLASLEIQLQLAAENLNKGLSTSHSLYERGLPHHIELERQAAASRIEARMHDLTALREEANVHHELEGTAVKQQILEYIDRDVARCKEETQLLKSAALAEMPRNLTEAIIGFANGDRMSKNDGVFSPAHWAAENGRRDLLYFIHARAGGEVMLEARDDMGSTPLLLAERNQRVGPVHFLRSVLRSRARAPEYISQQTAALPPAYKKLLDQIETRGWSTIKWKDNHTMLHWAASKGKKDLCAYLLHLNADPSVKDHNSQTPSACAAAAGHPDIVQLLQEARASRPSKIEGGLGSSIIGPAK